MPYLPLYRKNRLLIAAEILPAKPPARLSGYRSLAENLPFPCLYRRAYVGIACSFSIRYNGKQPLGNRLCYRSFRDRLLKDSGGRNPAPYAPLRRKRWRRRADGNDLAPNLRYRRTCGTPYRALSRFQTLCKVFFCERALIRRAHRVWRAPPVPTLSTGAYCP